MGMARKKTKSPPLMSHEFLIQNHADILACLAVIIVIGLLFDTTAKISKLFIFLQHPVKNKTEPYEDETDDSFVEFERGIFDAFNVFFASLLIAVVHAILQEYVIDKLSRKLHLSKRKTSKFSDCCQIVVWSTVTAVWGTRIVIKGGLIQNLALLWENYPHNVLEWEAKIFFLSQMAYAVHLYPELYFQKVRKEDVSIKVRYYSLHIIFLVGAYVLHFWRIAIVILTSHCIAEAVFRISRVFYHSEKNSLANIGFAVYKFVFPTVRVFILSIGILTFWFGLGKAKNQDLDFSIGNFNSRFIRLTCLASLCIQQMWLMLPFVRWQLEEIRKAKEVKKMQADLKSRTSGKKTQKKIESEDGNTKPGKTSNKLKKN